MKHLLLLRVAGLIQFFRFSMPTVLFLLGTTFFVTVRLGMRPAFARPLGPAVAAILRSLAKLGRDFFAAYFGTEETFDSGPPLLVTFADKSHSLAPGAGSAVRPMRCT